MRLTATEQEAVRRSAREAFGPAVVVRVFGSRLDDSRRGGDIDLHIQIPVSDRSAAAAGAFRRLLNTRLGERDYDIVVAIAGNALSSVDSKALAEGVVL